MTWARIDDGFRDHPRFLDMSSAAVGLWASSLAYCNKHSTDGHVPVRALAKLAPIETPKARAAMVAELLGRGAWEPAQDGGYLVHDFLDWNDSKAEVQKRREAGRRGAAARWGPDAHRNADRIADGTAGASATRSADRNAGTIASRNAFRSDRSDRSNPDPERVRAGKPDRSPEPDPEATGTPTTPAEIAAKLRELMTVVRGKAMP